MSVHRPGKISTAQGWIFALVVALPGMAWASFDWLWKLIPPNKALAVLSWVQVGLIELGVFVVILLGACLFNAWFVVTVEVRPERRRREFVKLAFIFLVLQVLITPFVVGVSQLLLGLGNVF